MASSQDRKDHDSETASKKMRTGLSLVGSFLRLFDKPTRILFIACAVVIAVSLCVIVPKGPDELMWSVSGPETNAYAASEATSDPKADGTERIRRISKSAVPAPAAVAFRSWRQASGGTHIDLSKVRNLHIRVSIADQKVYVMSSNDVVYTMICSTGMSDSTPRGEFTVQNRGEDFFNESENMGANYWVSWANYGEYLFHSVPTDRAGRYIVPEAEKLGRPASHGCVRLTVADARWLYEQLPSGTHVTIA